MRFVVTIYALSTQASVLSFFISALWGAVLMLRKRGMSDTYKLALVANHILMAVSCLLLLILSFTQVWRGSGLSLMYSLVALAVLPCVYAYLPKQQPRYQLGSLALAALFASGMVLRALQVLPSHLMQGRF
jgi:hypothetical protein